MSRLEVRLDMGSGPIPDLIVPLVIISSKTRDRYTMMVHGFETVLSPDLSPGSYIIKADLPNGQKISQKVSLDQNQFSITLTPRYTSPRETLNFAFSTRPLAQHVPSLSAFEPVNCGFRIWHRADIKNRIEVVSPSLTPQVEWSPVSEMPGIMARVILPPLKGQAWLQIGSPEIASTITAIPSPSWRSILIYNQGMERGLGQHNHLHNVRASVITMNGAIESLFGYLERGSYEALRQIEEHWAVRLLRDKTEEPSYAVVAAYALLKAGSLDRLAAWVNNLAHWFPYLPDGFIILSALALREDIPLDSIVRETDQMDADIRMNRFDLAKFYLMKAAALGLPVFTEGFKLLAGMYTDTISAAESLSYVERAAKSLDWDRRTTTFYGTHPLEPTIIPRPILQFDESWTRKPSNELSPMQTQRSSF